MYIQSNLTKKIAIYCICIGLMVGCGSNWLPVFSQTEVTSETCLYSKTSLELADLPKFLLEIYPLPNSTIKHECYLKSLEKSSGKVGVFVVIKTEEIVEIGDNLVDPDVIDERINLNIDTLKTTDVSTYFGTDLMILESYDDQANVSATWAGPHVWKSLPVDLAHSQHTATVQVHKTSGKVLEYSWTFTIEP